MFNELMNLLEKKKEVAKALWDMGYTSHAMLEPLVIIGFGEHALKNKKITKNEFNELKKAALNASGEFNEK